MCLKNDFYSAKKLLRTAYDNLALYCGPNMVQCLSGHCRSQLEDCPQSTTCPEGKPVKCQDG
jgi:hypothetical protein